MKRGFLNTEKAKCKLTEIKNVLNGGTAGDVGQTKADRTPIESDVIEDHPLLPDLHSVSSTSRKFLVHCPRDKDRFVFRFWPRDPNGEAFLPSSYVRGKETGNGIDLWGATLYDFYFVRRRPGDVHSLTISTGSKLVEIMKALGELEHAKDEIARASCEAEPKELPGWDPAQAIVAYERRVHLGPGTVSNETRTVLTTPGVSGGRHQADVHTLSVPKPGTSQVVPPNGGAESEATENPALEDITNQYDVQPVDPKDKLETQPDISLESPFHPSHYPSPWPLVPFESPYTPFALQRRIPIHLLPKKLYVHDPWNLVHCSPGVFSAFRYGAEKSSASSPEHMHTYTLSLRPKSQRKISVASEFAATAEEDEAVDPPETVFILPREMEGPNKQPAIRAFLPKRPRKPTEAPEAHLYLSPTGELGTGNHSIVYEAEFELPRDLFCENMYCQSCLDEQIKFEVDKLKESGEWERRLNEAAKIYESHGEQVVVTSGDSPSTSSVQIPPHYFGIVKARSETPQVEPSQQSECVSDTMIDRPIEYDGLVIDIHPNIQWQNPSCPETICDHQAKEMKPVPRTARFRVAAKLSYPYDSHLQQEADNYIKFPDHFFQHWTGYNVVPPLVDPTSVGAIVPQFFGYYKPDSQSESNNYMNYRSPILLVEHCGKPISVDMLTKDEAHECAALLFRFHAAGWLHKSFAERNILWQERHPACSPLEEQGQCDSSHRDCHGRRSFRLIDFGRSITSISPAAEAEEEDAGKALFGIL